MACKKKDTSFLLNMSNVTAFTLEMRGTISSDTFTLWERAVTIVKETPKLYSLAINPHQRIIAWEQTQDSFYFQYDYWFRLFQLNNIQLNLKDVKVHKTAYSIIPQEHNRNRVFRQFKCFLSKEPIRYPVIALDKAAGRPIRPMRLFERKNLLKFLCFSDFYPGTTQELDLDQVKEHLGVKRIIKAEMIRLNIILS
jgi:hypothetical protein